VAFCWGFSCCVCVCSKGVAQCAWYDYEVVWVQYVVGVQRCKEVKQSGILLGFQQLCMLRVCKVMHMWLGVSYVQELLGSVYA